MMIPKRIREAEGKLTEELKIMQYGARKALFDQTLSDEEADTIIEKSNVALKTAGMPAGGLTMTRAAYRAAWPKMGV